MPRRSTRKPANLQLLELLEHIDHVAVGSEIQGVVANLLEIYGLKSLAYLGTGVSEQPGVAPYLAVTYSVDWIEHYKAERFLRIDPTIQIGLRRMVPIDWDGFDHAHTEIRRLFGEAREFGLGRRGISLPVHGRHGDRALLSLTSDATEREWKSVRVA